MFRKILTYGAIAGAIAGVWLSISTIAMKEQTPASWSMAIGYLAMLVALSTIFVAVKRQRDIAQGGVIRFWPALAMGLAISLIAGVIYVVVWDLAQALAHYDFASSYAQATVEHAQARGASGAALARVTAEMDQFKVQYANPLYRWPMTFAEIFPVGVLVSLISAALLRNSRFMPARRAAIA
jgi:hypothetical protein